MFGIEDLSPENFKSTLYQAAEIVVNLYTNIREKPVFQSREYSEILDLFNENLPLKGESISELLQSIEKDIITNSSLHFHHQFYAWVTSNASQASILGEIISTALNVNATSWLNAPPASEIEQIVIKWICQFIGYDLKANGVLLSGGSMSNYTALRVAISENCPYDFEEMGFDRKRPLRIYTSAQNHFCIDKAVAALGIGSDNLQKIEVDENFRIDLRKLERQILSDLRMGYIPLAIVGNAGTVNTGAVDPIEDLKNICERFNLWLHLDAAYGGFSASIQVIREKEFKGLELANSMAIDLHKWLFVPFECGALLMKNSKHLKNTFSFVPDYQKFDHIDEIVDFSEYSMQQSRNFKALKVWMNFKAYGAEKLRYSIENSIDVMTHLRGLIEKSEDFELMAPQGLSIICFRYNPSSLNFNDVELNKLNRDIIKRTEKDGRVFIRETVLNGKVVIRGCCTNFRRRKEDVAVLLNVLGELGINSIADNKGKV